MTRHIGECPTCAVYAADYARMRAAVRRLPLRQPSAHLRTALQVLASRESMRRRKRLNWSHALQEWRDAARLSAHNLMRPLALPVAGGLVSTLLLFGMLVPDLAHEVHPVTNDIETSVFTQPTVKDVLPIGTVSDEIAVDLTVDEQGRMLDYRVVDGEKLLQDDSIRRRLEMNLLSGQFNPATRFGQPIAGKLRVTFRSSTIEIKG